MSELLELAERCEKAAGPDRAIDFDIAEFVTRAHMATGKAPAYTASLDAAMTLIDDSEIWGVSKQEHNPGRDYYYQASVMPFGPKPWHEAKAASAALALCAAALRAKATLTKGEGDKS